MRKFAKRFAAFSGLLALCMLLGGASLALAAAQDFVIVNNTGSDVHGIYISPSSAEDWESNLIEGSVFPNGNEVEIHFTGYDPSEAHWDIMVTDENDDSLTWEDINLLKYGRITLNFDGQKAWVDLE